MGGFSTHFLESCFHYSTIAALVLAGLTAISAFISGFSGYEVADRLQKESNEKISATDALAAAANESAAKLAVDAENMRNANLVLQAQVEKERMARLKLEKDLSPRRLTKAHQEIIHARLSRYKGQVFILSSVSGDPESFTYSEDIKAALIKAGWSWKKSSAGMYFPTPIGLQILAEPETKNTVLITNAVRELIETLRFLSIEYSVHGDSRVLSGEVEIRVGGKPPVK